MTRNKRLILVLLIALTAVIGLSLVTAQDIPAGVQAWEHAVLIYGNEDGFVFTSDLAANNGMNEQLEAIEDLNVVAAMDVVGAEGWEFVAIQQGGAQTIYVFKRPVG